MYVFPQIYDNVTLLYIHADIGDNGANETEEVDKAELDKRI